MDALNVVKTIRKYFETTLNSTAFQLDVEKTLTQVEGIQKIWIVDIKLRPFYGGSKKYEIRIDDSSGDILNIEAKEDSNNA